jgi:hypothetical protein
MSVFVTVGGVVLGTAGVAAAGAAGTALVGIGTTALVGGVANSVLNKPKSPATPDFAKAATAQGQENIDAARASARLSNPNYDTPYGSRKITYGSAPKFDQAGYDAAMAAYQKQPYNEEGKYYNALPTREQFTTAGDPNQPTITDTLTPAAQAALENQQKVQQGLSEVGLTAFGNVRDTMSKPFASNVPDFQTSLGDQGPVDYGPSADQYGLAKGDLDLSGIAKMPINAGMTAQQAIMSRLGPQLEAQRASTFQSLRNQGVTEGSEAWNNAIRSQQQGENDLMTQAQLQGLNLDMSANQQGYGQQLSSAGLYNQAVGQNFDQGIRSAGLYNQAQNQKYNQALGSAEFGNTALNQQYQRNLGEYYMPLNTLTALQNGSQIQTPQFQPYQGQTIDPAPIANATTNAANFAQNKYAQDVAANNAVTNGLFDIAKGGFSAGFSGGGGGLFGAPKTGAPKTGAAGSYPAPQYSFTG